ncbi:hypothetical protein GF352_03055 [archaeon]|nr:hypothetical protein [archaeon]
MILTILGFLLKISYIIPFLVFYVLFKRYNSIVKNRSYQKFVTGIVLFSLAIGILLVLQVIVPLGLIDDLSVNIVLVTQLVSNTFLIIAYNVLLKGLRSFSLAESRINIRIYFIFLLLFLSVSSLSITDNVLLVLIIVSNSLAMFSLILCFLLISNILKQLHIKYYVLPAIGIFFLVIDPILCFKTYPLSLGNAVLIGDLSATGLGTFYYYRLIAYIFTSIAMVFVLAPVFYLLLKILTRQVITFDSDDSVPERVIKKLTIRMQRVVGKVAFTIIQLASRDFEERFKKVDYTNNLDIKNLSAKDKKEFLKMVIKRYYKTIGKPVTNNILKKISGAETREVIIDCSDIS